MVWAPLFEEAVFRVVIFYVVLQRSGGNVGLACLASACTFGGIHVANVLAAAGGGAAGLPADVAYAWLQVVTGAVCGAAWVLVFARTGSFGAVALLHAANNAAAVAWMGARALAAAGEGKGVDAAACAASAWGPEDGGDGGGGGYLLVASVALQLGLYAHAAWSAWGGLYGELVGAAGAGGEAVVGRFRALHPVVYGGEAAEGEGLRIGDGEQKEE
jgi:hypothetical protein